MELLPNRLRNARKNAHLTQRELAARCDMDQGHLSRVERGEASMSLELLQCVAKQLGVSVSDLVGDANGTSPPDIGAAAILADENTPPGLREFAADTSLAGALRVTQREWQALASLQLPSRISKDGYVQLLITIRAISA